jgi:septal ring factor EnvC (AmiA/AmiB activator)
LFHDSYVWLALEAQLAASQSEQQAVLERCYASSAENENLRKTITDLRRRLEESQAALHELGRENQTLQVNILWYILKVFAPKIDLVTILIVHMYGLCTCHSF